MGFIARNILLLLLILITTKHCAAQVLPKSLQKELDNPTEKKSVNPTAKNQITQSNNTSKKLLKIMPDADCNIYVNGELKGTVKSCYLLKLYLQKGDYIIKAVSTNNDNNYVQQQYSITETGTEKILQLSLASVINANNTSKNSTVENNNSFKVDTSSFLLTDKQGNKYSTVKIGTQVWISTNLATSQFRNGDSIPEIEDTAAWAQAAADGKPAWCYYNSDAGNERTYGKLYNWYAVNDPRGLAPDGWHIPTDAEWTVLTTYLGGENVSGTKLKSTSGWGSIGNGTNENGLSGLPGGYRSNQGTFGGIGQYGDWWSSSENRTLGAWYRFLYYNSGGINGDYARAGCGFSVRCLRD